MPPLAQAFTADVAVIEAAICAVRSGWSSAGSAARHLENQLYSQDGKWGVEQGPVYFLGAYQDCLGQVISELIALFDDLSDLTVGLGDLAVKAKETDKMTSADLQHLLDSLDSAPGRADAGGESSASPASGGFGG